MVLIYSYEANHKKLIMIIIDFLPHLVCQLLSRSCTSDRRKKKHQISKEKTRTEKEIKAHEIKPRKLGIL
jgi:hypothetical protein